MNAFKKPFWLMFVLLMTLSDAPFVQAQAYTGDLELTSQAEVDAFNYTEVTGQLFISGADPFLARR